MPADAETKSLAVLIDADNTSAKHAQAIFDEIVKLGEANVRRIYGDFSGSRLAGWDGAIKSLAILQHQQRSNSKGKNASDIALVIDAMDLMYKRTLDGVVLVSSDSDFTRLAVRISVQPPGVTRSGLNTIMRDCLEISSANRFNSPDLPTPGSPRIST